jgi:hypothetical protein
VRHEVLTAVLINMPAMRTDICIPSQEPAFSILRAVQEKHTPSTPMKLNAASSSKTITPTYQTTLHCTPENWNCVLPHGVRINSGFNQKNAWIYVTRLNFFMPTLTQRKQKPKEKL